MSSPALPQLAGDRLFITDGGLETDLIYHQGYNLPCFAAFPLLGDGEGTRALRDYYERYIEIAREHGLGFLLDTVTWRANPDWGERLAYSADQLDAANRRAVALAREIRDANADVPILITGCIGPRGDAYSPDELMTPDEAARYHLPQIAALADAGVDFVTALTLTNAIEAIGIARAAGAARVPAVISFTVETDGRLPSGEELREAIEATDAGSEIPPVYYMINCAHPTHFADVLEDDGEWRERIRGVRSNASSKSHEELDESDELDEGNPIDLADRYRALFDRLPNLTVLGGCCGTDHRHVAQACAVCAEAFPAGR
jgi:S-methylmethionine-dependent homocysteine/selenocysteine methylase